MSVVIPVYNGENYLEDALKSILLQHDNGIEVIAIDGGSSDRTIEILESYTDQLPMPVMLHAHGTSWMAKANLGLALARGDFVSFLHHDDLWLADRLGVLKALVNQAPETTIFLHPSWFIDPLGKHVGLWRCPLPSDTAIEAKVMRERLIVQNFISMPAPLFSRKAALSVGGLDEELWYTADWDLWLKLANAGKTIYHGRPLSGFRIHPKAQTMRGSCDLDDFRRQQEVVLTRHLGSWSSVNTENYRKQQVARFSIEVNTALAGHVHGQRLELSELASGFISLGPCGWYRYLRDSRIIERSFSRYRIGLENA